MITLHRLGHKLELFHLNPDLIATVEGHPDTVITLATGSKIVVAETPQREDGGATVSPLRPALVDQSELA
jgi:uncharacterized protein YlzI (FlbEa/FlbD family)